MMVKTKLSLVIEYLAGLSPLRSNTAQILLPLYAAIAAGRWWGSQYLNLRTFPNGREVYRFGFTVSKAIGNAVVRNRVKRRLRAVVQTTEVLSGFDVVVSARPSSANVPFKGLKADFLALLERAKMLGKSAPK